MIQRFNIPSPTLPLEQRIERLVEMYDCVEGDRCGQHDCPLCELRGAYSEATGIMQAALDTFIFTATEDKNVIRSA